jgi:alpha-acetolactate decarboxylase
MAAKIPNDIFQNSTTGALQAGYAGTGPIVHHLQGYGSHGLGAIAGTEEELVFLDSQAYLFSNDKTNTSDHKHIAKPANGNAGLSFVMVTRFSPEYAITVNGSFGKDALLDLIRSQGGDAGGKNSFIPFQIRGKFAKICVKANESLRRQHEPSMKTVSGNNSELVDIQGTIFGFIGPECFAGVSVTGVHCFFLSDKDGGGARRGGSFVDFETQSQAQVSWAVTGRYHLGFPRGEEWEKLEIQQGGTS